jgi:hypothetical protein
MNSEKFKDTKEFEFLINQLLQKMGYKILIPDGDSGYDLVVVKDGVSHFVEIKFYRSQYASRSIIRKTANRLAYSTSASKKVSGLLIANYSVNLELQVQIFEDYGIQIWDRELLYKLFSEFFPLGADQYERLLIESQQGTNIAPIFNKKNIKNVQIDGDLLKAKQTKYDHVPIVKGEELCEELKNIACGRDNWRDYELKCQEVLEYLFEEDLSLWEQQARTDDGLSRFDLVCRIASRDDYWKSLVSSFNTRFVLFEFKNYCDLIKQNQIYTTERYLFNKALRSVGFIISRNGASENAIIAAKGALKEHGKLILILSDTDICNMLKLKDKDDSPNDYLSEILDRWLIALSR